MDMPWIRYGCAIGARVYAMNMPWMCDVLWICYGYAVDKLWICYGDAMYMLLTDMLVICYAYAMDVYEQRRGEYKLRARLGQRGTDKSSEARATKHR